MEDNAVWDVTADGCEVDAAPGDNGRDDVGGVPARLRKGELGLMGGVAGRDGACCGEPGRGGAPEVTVAPRWRYGGTADAACTGAGKGMRRESIYRKISDDYIVVLGMTRRTEVRRRPGSPKEDRQEISSRPRGIILPGA